MARLPRLTLPHCPHHLIQRGNNRQRTFEDAADFEQMLALLAEYAGREKVAVHSYVLMDNHFHLLVTPETATALPRMMQAVGRRYVQAFNKRHQRSGSLWEGRYRATVIQPERHFLACMAYIDLNPVRAGLVARAADYRWSSHAHYAGLRTDKLLTPHGLYWQLGNTPYAREARYAQQVEQGLRDEQRLALTDSALKGWALGDEAFLQQLQDRLARRPSRARAGRPFARRDGADEIASPDLSPIKGISPPPKK